MLKKTCALFVCQPPLWNSLLSGLKPVKFDYF